MKLARYWTRSQGEAADSGGQRIRVVTRGWSDESIDDARNRAQERARRLAQRIASDPSARKQYDYDDAPVPEAVVRDFRPEGLAAVVTRNSYGSLVLNADNLLFADVDQEEQEKEDGTGSDPAGAEGLEAILSGLFSMFGGKQENPLERPKVTGRPLSMFDKIERLVEAHGFAARVYRTAAGHRVMVTDRQMPAGGDEIETILNEFGSDPLYLRLCRTQQSFRARLTPKPWRCGVRKPPVKFPFEGPGEQAAIRQWQAEYDRRIADYATCRLVRTFGGDRVHPSLQTLVDYHDRETKATSDLPLA